MRNFSEWKKQREIQERGNKIRGFFIKWTFILGVSGFLYVNYIHEHVPQSVKHYVSSTVDIDISSYWTLGDNNTTDDGTVVLTKNEWSKEQIKNILLVEEASKYVNHPNPKRVVAHLLCESNANTVVDGDVGNGFSKKSYSIMQVKLGTVYYNKEKRPDLFTLYAPEVNKLPKEEILEKLRKDPFFNAKMGAITHLVLMDVCGDPDRASVAYNRGKCDADDLGNEYLQKIFKNEKRI